MHNKIEELLAAHKRHLDAESEGTDAEYERTGVELEEAKDRLLRAAPSTSQPFGWTKQSEIESSRKYGGSCNVWLQKHDCDTPLFATSVAAPSTSEEVSKLKDLLGEVSAHFTRDDDLPNDLLPRIDAAIKGGA